MPLATGDKLGPFEIVALLGEGGMGEVYKARDTRLDRIVALKVQKAQFSERFDREARAVAALNHPNICQLYDVGPNYLVMEFVEGEQLKGPLALASAVEYSAQILNALDAAHKRGITHRDLKPANVIVAKQGVKLLDFGLAKQGGTLRATDETLTQALTGDGQILGTLQYMSPEQAQGQSADARSDMFAFGCLFHELITGKRAFAGDNAAAVIASILKDEPAPRDLPEPLDRVIKSCLAKDPDNRFQSAADCKRALQWAFQAAPPQKTAGRLWQIAVGLLVAALAIVAFKPAKAPEVPQPVTFQINPPAGYRFSPGDVRLSPDGQTLAFLALGGPFDSSVWVRPLRSLEATRLTGTEGTRFFFWSHDSTMLGLYDESNLRRIKASGGPIENICASSNVVGATWGKGGAVLFGQANGPLQIVRPGGTSASDFVKLDAAAGETRHRSPAFLADGEHFIYRVDANSDASAGVYFSSISGGTKRRLPIESIRVNSFFSPPLVRYGGGYLTYRKGDVSVAHAIDSMAGNFLGDPLPLGSGSTPATSSLSENRTFTVVLAGQLAADGKLTEVDRTGKRLRTLGPDRGYYTHIEMSPDGKSLLMDYRDPAMGIDVWSMDLQRETTNRLTFPPIHGSEPVWSADGHLAIFGSGNSIYSVSAAAGGQPRKIADADSHHKHATPDGKYLLFEWNRSSASNSRLAWFSFDSPATLMPLVADAGFAVDPQVSPDGKWFAYAAGSVASRSVYVESLPPGKGKWQISRDGGTMIRWRRDGRELYFRNYDRQIVAVEIGIGPDGILQPGQSKALFEQQRSIGEGRYAVSPDGQRFYYTMSAGSPEHPAPTPVTVTLNWLPR